MPTHSWDSNVYYKIRIPQRNYNFFVICTLQDFDETDYVTDHWLTDDDGVVSFDTEQQAREYLAANVDEKWVLDADRILVNHVDRYRRADA